MDEESNGTAMNNVTVPSDPDPFYIAVEIVCAIVAIFGNFIVIYVFSKDVKLRTTTNYYVISLATADLLVGLVGIPAALATAVGLPRNFHGCIFMNSILMLLCTSSILSLVAVTVDRYWCIIHPMSYPVMMTHKRALMAIVISWILAAIIGLLPSLGWNKGMPKEPSCFFMDVIDLRYLVFIYFTTIVVPSAFMAAVYAVIYKAVKRQVRRMSTVMLPKEVDPTQRLNQESRAARSLAIIVILFVISWIPLYTLNTVMYFCESCTGNVPPSVFKSFIVLSHCNSAWNPALYAWGMKDFKEALFRLCGIIKKSRTVLL